MLKNLTPKTSLRIHTISAVLKQQNEPDYQLKNVLASIYRKRNTKYSDIGWLSMKTREKLIEAFDGNDLILASSVTPSTKTESKQCTKLLFDLHDKQAVEAVWMQFRDSQHSSVCISSQVGCALKCSFCATGAVGFKRQLSTDEIVDQVLYFLHGGRSVDTISFMGMGEALQNPRVFDALDLLTDVDGFGFSPRRLNVSTVGIIPGIQRLTTDYPNVNLAFSLHSPFDEQRTELVPANKIFPLKENLEALKEHAQITKRRIVIAYLILPNYNDSPEHAKEIANIINSMKPVNNLFHVNLLRYNPAEGIGADYKRTDRKHLDNFSSILKKHRISFTLRQSFGLDIDAACGQLYQVTKTALKKADKLSNFTSVWI